MTHHFVAANVWLVVALTLLIGEWGAGRSCRLFGYGSIEPPLYAGAVLAAFGAAGFFTHRWFRSQGPAGGPPPAGFAIVGQAWLIGGLVLVLGMQKAGESDYFKLFGYGRVEPPVYWGVLMTAFAAAGFGLLRWSRGRSADGPPPAGRDLARVGLAWLGAVGVYAVNWVAIDHKPPNKPDDLVLLGGIVLVYLFVLLAIGRAAFGGPPRPVPAMPPAARKRSAGLTDGMRAGALMVGVAAVGLLAVTTIGHFHEVVEPLLPWWVGLLAIGFLGALVLLVAVLTARPAPAAGAGAGPGRRPTDATPTLFRVLGGIAAAGMALAALLPLLGAITPPQAFLLLLVGGTAAIGTLLVLIMLPRPTARTRPAAVRPACPTCGEPIPDGSPAGLCPKCLLKGGMPTGPDARPTLAFVESYAAPPVEDVRKLFPHLAVERLIGQGGMGAVYLARQPALDRPVALKLIRRRADDPTFVERFAREARTMAKLAHPNVVAVHESGEAGGLPYLVMEYVSGPTLRDAMKSRALSPAAALAVVRQVCDALEFAHRQGVVHRDIKPENILLSGVRGQGSGDSEDRTLPPAPCPLSPGSAATVPCVKITDFGLAKVIDPNAQSLTGTWQAMGTPHYMAPEQWEKPAAVDHRADIYALGVVLYELLTGELPLGRFDPPSRKIEVDVRVDEVVLRALEKEPGRRYQHAREVGTDLDHIRTDPGP